MNEFQKNIIEKYANKKFYSEDFTYKDYINLRKELRRKNILDSLTQNKTTEQIDKLSKTPKVRNKTSNIEDNILCASIFAGFASGILTTKALLDAPNVAELLLGTIAGITAGAGCGYGNVAAYENKPLSNAINNIKIKSKNRKVKKLEQRKELRDYTQFCFKQYERNITPTFEDFLKNKDNNNSASNTDVEMTND